MSTKMTVACAWKDPKQNLDVTIEADLGATTKVWTGYRGRLHTIEHNLTTLNSLTPRDCATLSINVVQCFMTEGARHARDRTKYWSDGKRRDLDLVSAAVITFDGKTVDKAVVREAPRTPLRLGLEAWADN